MGATWLAQDVEIARLRALVDLKDIQLMKLTERCVLQSAELERTLAELGRVARELAKLRGPLPPVEYAARDSTVYYAGKYDTGEGAR